MHELFALIGTGAAPGLAGGGALGMVLGRVAAQRLSGRRLQRGCAVVNVPTGVIMLTDTFAGGIAAP
jgi:hypothetical protein